MAVDEDGVGRARGRVLVVDDEPTVAALIRDVLVRRGLEVTTHVGGEEAVRRAVDGDFDLVVSDFAIPGMNGLEFARRVARERPRMAVLIVSAFLDADTEEELDGLDNVAGFVRKPFDIRELAERVERALRPSSGRAPSGGESALLAAEEEAGSAG